MNATSQSRADNSAPARPILIWDLPVRVFHWLMALSFAGAYLTAESERWRLVHISLGYTLAGLVVFRVLWGLAGSPYARFSQFVRGPSAVLAYLRSLVQGKPQHFLGHNPAGALAILGLLGLGLAVAGSGWAALNEIGGEAFEEVHEVLANLMLGLVVLHVAAVLVSSLLHRENLVAAMLHGKKLGQPQEGVRSSWRVLGVLLLAAVLGFWWLQYQTAPALPAGGAAQHQQHDEDDD